jgi:hypothetical protein
MLVCADPKERGGGDRFMMRVSLYNFSEMSINMDVKDMSSY